MAYHMIMNSRETLVELENQRNGVNAKCIVKPSVPTPWLV